jgi:hypothetical protein
MRWAGHVARIGDRRGAYRVSVGRPEGRRPLGKPKYRWENNIKVDLYEVGRVQVEGACEYVNEPSGSIRCGEFLG